MKKFGIFISCFVLALSLCACACSNMEPATEPSQTQTTTSPTVSTTMPTATVTIPVPETNIPDPETNNNSTIPEGSSAPGTNSVTGPSSGSGIMG